MSRVGRQFPIFGDDIIPLTKPLPSFFAFPETEWRPLLRERVSLLEIECNLLSATVRWFPYVTSALFPIGAPFSFWRCKIGQIWLSTPQCGRHMKRYPLFFAGQSASFTIAWHGSSSCPAHSFSARLPQGSLRVLNYKTLINTTTMNVSIYEIPQEKRQNIKHYFLRRQFSATPFSVSKYEYLISNVST